MCACAKLRHTGVLGNRVLRSRTTNHQGRAAPAPDDLRGLQPFYSNQNEVSRATAIAFSSMLYIL